MKAMIYSTSWCVECQRMAEYLKSQYSDLDVQLVGLDLVPPDAREKALAALRKLTWSDLLPVTLLDDNVIIGTDYMALIAILGPAQEKPPRGSSEHQHSIDPPDAT
jgi:hypothetical protein